MSCPGHLKPLFSKDDVVLSGVCTLNCLRQQKKSISTYYITSFMNSQQTLGRLGASRPINLLILFKAYAKITSGETKE